MSLVFKRCKIIGVNNVKFIYNLAENKILGPTETEKSTVSPVFGLQHICVFSTVNTGNELIKLNNMAMKVIQFNQRTDVMAACIPVGLVSNLLKNLFDFGFSDGAAFNLLTKSPWIMRKSHLITDMANILLSHNLPADILVHILENLPLEYKEEKLPLEELPSVISSCLESLTNIGFSRNKIASMLSVSPQIVYLSHQECVETMSKLKGLVDSKVDVIDIVAKYPNVLTDSWEDITKKFEYVYYAMIYEVKDIANSSVFQHSYDHIVDRHIYLMRTGYFVRRKRKEGEKPLNVNPSLKTVFDSNDIQFAQLFGNLNKQEYAVYLQMRQLERQNVDEELMDDEITSY